MITEKELKKLNRDELLSKAKELDITYADDALEKIKDKDIVKAILEKQEAIKKAEEDAVEDPKTDPANAPGNKNKKSEKATAKVDGEVIKVNRRIACYIGPDYYEFKTGIKYQVSPAVKKILIDRGVVVPTY